MPDPTGDVVNLAVMFTDLVGSTALAERVGPEAAERLRREHFDLLRGPVDGYGGLVVKNLGDGLMVTFERSSDAVACGVTIQQAIELRNRRVEDDPASPALAVRVAISAGEADRDGNDVFGPPVIEAARLCGIAEGGEILVSDVVPMLVGRRGGFTFRSLGPQELKGFDAAVGCSSVVWEPLDDGPAPPSIPLPAAMAHAPPAFVGRVAEQQFMHQAWAATTGGAARVVLLGGEAGIGKTTLAAEVARRAHTKGAVVLYGRCEDGLGVAYRPWRDALEHLVEHAPTDLLESHVAARGGDLARLVPGFTGRYAAPPPTESDTETERYLMFRAVADLVQRAARAAPVVVVLDDLHWADDPTIQLLRHLAISADLGRVLIVSTYRPTDVDMSHPLSVMLAGLLSAGGVDVLELGGLGDEDLLDLLERSAGNALGPDGIALRDALVSETAGNPFFVGELLRHLAETGSISDDSSGGWAARAELRNLDLPLSVRHVIRERVARLGARPAQLLAAAAVIGREFDLELLATVTASSVDDVYDALERATAAALITSVGPTRFAFIHALVERTLYEAIIVPRRALLHRSVAEALETRTGDREAIVTDLARHWALAGTPESRTAAARYAQRAGEIASASLAPEQAVAWFERALELIGPEGEDRHRCELLLRLGTAERDAGRPAHREHLLDAVRLGDEVRAADVVVDAALANSRGFFSAFGAVDAERVAALERALELVTVSEPAQRARLMATLASETVFSGDTARTCRLADEAVQIAQDCGDPTALVDVAARTSLVRWVPERIDDHERVLIAALGAAEETADPVRRCYGHFFRRHSLLLRGDREAAAFHAEVIGPIVEDAATPALRWLQQMDDVVEAVLDGELIEAEERAFGALEAGLGSGQPDAELLFRFQLLTIRYHQGRLGEIADLLAAELASAEQVGVRTTLRIGLMSALCQGGELERARTELAHLRPNLDEDILTTIRMGQIIEALMADVALVLGDRELARWVIDRLWPARHLVFASTIMCEGAVAHRLGCLAALLGEHVSAIELLEEGLERNRRLRSPLHVITSLFELSRVLEATDPARAEVLRRECDELRERLDVIELPGAAGRWQG
jgi:class 3 adenylate cyclase